MKPSFDVDCISDEALNEKSGEVNDNLLMNVLGEMGLVVELKNDDDSLDPERWDGLS
jgi:hypothetical protein